MGIRRVVLPFEFECVVLFLIINAREGCYEGVRRSRCQAHVPCALARESLGCNARRLPRARSRSLHEEEA